MSLVSDQKNDDFKKPADGLIFKTLEEMSQNFLANDNEIFTSFKANKFNQIRKSLLNLKTLENFKANEPIDPQQN